MQSAVFKKEQSEIRKYLLAVLVNIRISKLMEVDLERACRTLMQV